jgi:hypothetical protein
MAIRRSLLALAAIATFALSACAGTSASAIPSVAVPSIPASVEAVDLQGFCEDFAATISSDWPDIDQSTATELSGTVSEWAASPELASIQGDIQTIGTWLATVASAGAPASPPPDVETAFQNVTTFADANC